MIVNATASTPATAPSAAGAASGTTDGAHFVDLLGGQGANSPDVVSGIKGTLPDGKTFGVSLVSLAGATSGTNATGAATPQPTAQDKANDQAMLAFFQQMSSYFGQTATAENTELEGTAALDLKL